MKYTIRHVGRHRIEILNENGNVVDQAMGRENVLNMKEKYGLAYSPPPKIKQNDEIPTGFE